MNDNPTPPYNIQAEKALLGSLLMGNRSALDEIADRLTAAMFYLEVHRLIYGAMLKMDEANKYPDVISLAEYATRVGWDDQIAGGAYLTQLANNVTSSYGINTHADIIINTYTDRALIDAGNDITGLGYNPGEHNNAQEKLDQAEARLMQISGSVTDNSQATSLADIYPAFIADMERRAQCEGITGTTTGFYELDEMTDGLHDNQLIIIAGRPGMGKTALATCIAKAASRELIEKKQSIMMFSMEMAKLAMYRRFLVSEGVNMNHAKQPKKMNGDDLDDLSRYANNINQLPVYINDVSGLTPLQLRRQVRSAVKRQNLGMVVIDYIQLMDAGKRHTDNRTQEVSLITRELKKLAQELSIKVIAVSQLNRELEKRNNKRPQLSDLRESGSIEQDADLILFTYRDHVYNKKAPESKAEVIIGKQREGSNGTAHLAFDGQNVRFRNPTQEDWDQWNAAKTDNEESTGKRPQYGHKYKTSKGPMQ